MEALTSRKGHLPLLCLPVNNEPSQAAAQAKARALAGGKVSSVDSITRADSTQTAHLLHNP